MGIIFECCFSEWPGHLCSRDVSSSSMSESWIGERNLLSSLQRPRNASWFLRETLISSLLLSSEWGNFSGKGSEALLTYSHTPGIENTDLKQISSFNPSAYYKVWIFSFANTPWSNAKLKSKKRIRITFLWEIFLVVSYRFYILYIEV